MHSTKTNMALGSRPTACHWRRQEGYPALNARVRTKVLSEAPSKPQGIGGNGGKIEYLFISSRQGAPKVPSSWQILGKSSETKG